MNDTLGLTLNASQMLIGVIMAYHFYTRDYEDSVFLAVWNMVSAFMGILFFGWGFYLFAEKMGWPNGLS